MAVMLHRIFVRVLRLEVSASAKDSKWKMQVRWPTTIEELSETCSYVRRKLVKCLVMRIVRQILNYAGDAIWLR